MKRPLTPVSREGRLIYSRTPSQSLGVNVRILSSMSLLLLLTNCALFSSPKAKVHPADLPGAFANLTVDSKTEHPLIKSPIEYATTGIARYDKFFKDAAGIRAQLVVSQYFTQNLLDTLKSTSRDFAAANAADENVKEIVKGRKLEELSSDENAALAKLAKKSGKLSDEKWKGIMNSISQTAGLIVVLGDTAIKAVELAKSADGLVKAAPADFAGPQAMALPGVTAGIAGSGKNLVEAGKELPGLAKEMSKLAQALAY